VAAAIRSFTDADAEPAAALFRANTRAAVGDPASDGFVQGDWTAATLLRIAADGGVFVAVDDAGRLAGFVCSGPPRRPSVPSPLGPLLECTPGLSFGGRVLGDEGWITYGPVVVGAQWRGQGVARALFEAVRTHWRGRAIVGVLFIERTNTRSMAVHLDGFGMTELGGYSFDGRDYLIAGFAV
jgi:GNAT superfamily N-acetyltransferase